MLTQQQRNARSTTAGRHTAHLKLRRNPRAARQRQVSLSAARRGRFALQVLRLIDVPYQGRIFIYALRHLITDYVYELVEGGFNVFVFLGACLKERET